MENIDEYRHHTHDAKEYPGWRFRVNEAGVAATQRLMPGTQIRAGYLVSDITVIVRG